MKFYSIIAAALLSLMFAACSGGAKEQKSETPVDDEAFYSTQPVTSGQYRAVRYDIAGEKARKGMFDGRVLISLSPEQSGMYVFENGNRAKIDYKIVLKQPFEKGDSGVFRTVDVNDLPVTISADSTLYTLSFEKNKHQVNISFEQEPMNTGTALEIMERISAQIQKNK